MPHTQKTLTWSAVQLAIESLFDPSESDRIGLECEWPVYDVRDKTVRPNLQVLESVAKKPLPCGGNVTVEPGGQIELSSLPADSVGSALDAVARDSSVLHSRLAEWGLYVQDAAIDQARDPERILRRPRYAAMQSFFDSRGAAGRWMMCNTASVQINVSNGADPLQRWRLLNTIGPVLVAAFANSRGVDASGVEWASLRQGIWWNIDPQRTHPIPLSIDPAQSWLDYALAADVMFICGDPTGLTGTAVSPGLTFGQWMTVGHPLGWPTIDDLRYHLSTLFPSIRPKGWYEVRFLDSLSAWVRTAATVAVSVACREEIADDLLRRLPDTSGCWLDAARHGLRHPLLDKASTELFSVIEANADAASPGRAELARFVEEYVDQGRCPADDKHTALPIDLVHSRNETQPNMSLQ